MIMTKFFTHQYSNGRERDVDVHGLQAVLTSDLHTAGDARGRDGGKEISDDQLKALETSTDQVLTETGREKREREREREREKRKRHGIMLSSILAMNFLLL